MSERKGLTSEEVTKRIAAGKVNGIGKENSRTYKEIIAGNVFTFFNGLNLVLALCIALVHSFRNMLFMGVVFWNTLIGIVQEIRTKRLLDKMALLMESTVYAWRDGELCEIGTREIVLDDVLELTAGKQVSVDVEVLEGCCEVDESMLTGESEPVRKSRGDTILGGCHIISGSACVRVMAVGMDSYANKILKQVKSKKKSKSEIRDSIDKIIKYISIVIVPLGILMYIKQRYDLDLPQKQAVVKTVASVVSMIPDGLVLLTSTVMAVGIYRLAKEKAIVQDLYSIESLARVDVLCLDKTGTITEGSMEVEEVLSFSEKAQEEMVTAYFQALPADNPTSEALQKYFAKQDKIPWNEREKIAFSSKRKWGAVTFENGESYVLGAPEQVLGASYNDFAEKLNPYLERGRRVVVFAKVLDGQMKEEQLGAVDFYYAFVLKDKIRAHAEETFRYFQEEGVRLLLISGDHPKTVSNVGKQAGIEAAEKYIDARTLETETQIAEAVNKYTVFGRVMPEQKKQIVKALQKQGHVVAMTGDGVNDVLALKEADCSIVMDTGCDVARKTAKVVLEGSDFSVVPKVLKEGRRAINNLEDSATLFLTKTTFSSLLLFLFLVLQIPYPLQPIQMTLISSLSIGLPAFLLALEANYDVVQGSFLKKVFTRALPTGLLALINCGCVIVMSYLFHYGATMRTSMTAIGVVLANILLLCRLCKPWNKKKMALVVGIVVAFMGAIIFLRPVFLLKLPSVKGLLFLTGLFLVDTVLYNVLSKCATYLLEKKKPEK